MDNIYDAAISFASEQRSLAREITRGLSPLGYYIFYDEYNTNETWGRDLPELFQNIYGKTKNVIILISKEYLEKAWTKLERRYAIENLIANPDTKLLQIKLEKLSLPGVPQTIGHYDYDGDINALCGSLCSVLGSKSDLLMQYRSADITDIMEVCFRRAIFTSMDDEISAERMFSSIQSCIAKLNTILPSLRDGHLSQYVKSILNDLNSIDRYSTNGVSYTCLFNDGERRALNSLKLRIIDKLHYLNYKFDARIDIPDDIGLNYELSRRYNFVHD